MHGSRVGLSFLVVVLLLVFTYSAQTSRAADAKSNGLFHEVGGDLPPVFGIDTLADRLVGIDSGQLAQAIESPVGPKDAVTGKPPTPQTLVLNLFDDVVFTGVVEHVEPTASGHALWGGLEGVELGTMTMVVNGKIVVGTVRTPEAVYTIRTVGDGTYAIRQIDESSLPPLGEPLEDVPSPRDAGVQAANASSDDGSVIDVMVVYTPLAKQQEGGRAAIEALIDLFVTETNQAFRNSGAPLRVRLVFRDEVQYTEYYEEVGPGFERDGGPLLSAIDLFRLRDESDGYMDHIHELRDLYAADLIHLLTGSGDVGGVAYSDTTEDESHGFALTLQYTSGLVFAHELGHNLGLRHDRYQYLVREGRVSVDGSNYGYVNQRMFEPGAPESARWRTIMAYGTQCAHADLRCPWVQYFSTPDITYNDDPLGVPVDHPSRGADGPADAVGTLEETRQIVANYRRSSTSPAPRVGLALSPYWLDENGGESTVTATLHRPSSTDTTVTVSVSSSDAVRLSANTTLTIPAGRTTSAGVVTLIGVDNGNQTGDVSVTVSATAANVSDEGVIGPEPVELAIADDETIPVASLSLSPVEIVEGRDITLVTATLDSRSSAETTVTVSTSPAADVEIPGDDILIIPAGQQTSAGRRMVLRTIDDDVLAPGNRKSVTVSGVATNTRGVTGPESVTLTILDDEAPIFAEDSVAYIFTAEVAGSRFLPEAAYGDGPLTYSISPTPDNGVTFAPGPPARIGISGQPAPVGMTTYTLTATDIDGDTDTMTISVTIRSPVCPNSTAVSGSSTGGLLSDCDALLAAMDNLTGTATLNWSADTPIAEWDGVVIGGGRVTHIQLREGGLNGEIPAELGNLTNLRELNLGGNQLTGQIPAELGDLTNLRELVFWGNQLTGQISAQLGSLTNLERLSLDDNRLSGEIPSEFGSLANLYSLDLSANKLTGPIPPALGGLTKLAWLNLGSNQLTGSIPTQLGNLTNLRALHLDRNQLTGTIPSELGNLATLQRITLRGNQLTGCIPDALRNVGDDDSDNDLDQLGLSFCGDHSCAVDGAVSDGANNPGLVSDCDTLLEALDTPAGSVTLNWATDVSMAEWEGVTLGGSPKRVTRLVLRDKGLTGEIPSQLGGLPKLEWLDLTRNQLTGTIPAELGGLSNLQGLFLSGNQLIGCISDELRDIPNNDFTDVNLPFCSELRCVTGDAVADPTNTGLVLDCETLLAALDTLAGTATLNWATDTPITQWDGVTVGETSKRVTELSLGERGLTGEIPTELGSLANLHFLNLSENQLMGEIPAELGNLSKLRWLGVWGNQLTGEIPTELGDLSNLEVLALPSNRLTGEIPRELGNLSNLVELSLWGNQLTGKIPTELEHLSNLRTLWLDGNPLTGCIPPGLRDIPNNDLNRLGLQFCSVSSPGAPTVDAVTPGTGSLAVSWTTPSDHGGSVITAYDLRYIETSADETVDSNWTVEDDVWTTGGGTLEYTLTGLTGGTQYDLQIRAVNAEGNGPWSATTTGTPTTAGDCATGTAVPDSTNTGLVSDCATLLAARDTLAGTATLNWSTDTPIADWDGIGDDSLEGSPARVTRLYLNGMGLDGTIPSELSNLSALRVLHLHDNQLTGSIPPGLGGLSNLNYLYAYNNDLTGSIPEELGKLTSLTHLRLSDNDLNGEIPSEIGNMSSLAWLHIAQNNISGEIPAELGSLSSLRQLYLYDNDLSGPIPDELGNLSSLTHIVAQGNDLSGELPEELGNLENLVWLGLDDNDLEGEIPEEMGGLAKLQRLYLRHNELNGEIPKELGELSDMTDLWLNNNYLSGAIPAELGNLLRLKGLSFGQNQLSGPIPAELGDLSNLESLSLGQNQLSGPIPAELGDLSNLESLSLGQNQLSGPIPAELGDLSNLESLSLGQNQLSGPIPAELGDLSSLESLSLSQNQLSGPIPAELGDLSNLESLSLGQNQLSGPIPAELGDLSDLESLSLSENQLSGPIPAELGNLINLESMTLGQNQLNGSIPFELGDMTSMQKLRLHNNMLSGSIPTELGDLSNLTDLWLSGNELTGSIPSVLGGLDNLKQLSLKDNQLSGDIPSELGNLADTLTHLFLAGNTGLTGCVPAGLQAVARNDISDLGLDVCEPSAAEYYTQFEQVGLIQIKASDAVVPEALTAAAGIIRRMIEHRPDIAERLGDSGASLAIIPTNSYITELPEFRYLSGELDPNGNSYDSFAIRGAGGIRTQTTTATAEENLLDLPENSMRFWDEDITVHEWAHAIENIGFDNEMREEWLALFEAAREAGLFPGTFGLATEGGREFFAEMSQAFFGVDNRIKPEDFLGAGPVGTRILNALEEVYGPQPEEPLSGRVELERETLVELYNATDGANWTDNTNWLSDEPMREWYGVSTDDEGRVSELSLGNNQLSGDIPTELGNLSNLTSLSLWGNQLTGGIPMELGSLSNLTWLALNGNQLGGEMPTELGSLSNLRLLDLGSTQLTGEIPAELGNLTNLTELWLGGNRLTGEIPMELGSLSNLRALDLRGSRLTGEIPTELGNLTNLRELNLSSNQLTGKLPQSLTGLTMLEKLVFENNAGLCAPTDEAFQAWLQGVASVSGSSCVPDSAEDRAVLVEFYNATDGGNWTNNTNWLSDQPMRTWHGVRTDDGRVTELHLVNNRLKGEIPDEVGKLTRLEVLNLGYNEMTGPISAWVGELSHLRRLQLAGNVFHGVLPAELGSLPRLEVLTLAESAGFFGKLPEALTKADKVRWLTFHKTGLCAPWDEDFRTWLDGVSEWRGSDCPPGSKDIPTPTRTPYPTTTREQGYGYTIDIPDDWVEGDWHITSVPGGRLSIRELDLLAETTLEQFAESVRDDLERQFLASALLFEITSFEKRQSTDQSSYIIEYRLQENPYHCVDDVVEQIVLGSHLPGPARGYRLKHSVCEWELSRELDRVRRETMSSFRIVTNPDAYYHQYIIRPGVTIKAPGRVDPETLQKSAEILDVMLDGRQDIPDCLGRIGSALAIVADGDPLTALPEFSHLKDLEGEEGRYLNSVHAPGAGGHPASPVSATPEQMLRGPAGYPPFRDVHEPGHHVQLCFTELDNLKWVDLYWEAIEKVGLVDEYDPISELVSSNSDEFWAGFSSFYFFVHYAPRRYAKQLFSEAFAFVESVYGKLTPTESEHPGYLQYVTASGHALPWLVPGGVYENTTFDYRIELLPGWVVKKEGAHELLLASRNWPWPTIRIQYTRVPDGENADDALLRISESRRLDWQRKTRGWHRSEVKSFERVSLDGHDNYWIHFYGQESAWDCQVDVIERVLVATHDGDNYGVVLEGSACGEGRDYALQDFETMLSSFILPTSKRTPAPDPTPTPTPQTDAADIAGVERDALVALYNSTGGANWERNDNWLTDSPVGKWYGVKTVDGRVTKLYLGGNGLRGEIPPELGNLQYLRQLRLGERLGDVNRLTGDFPPELNKLTTLEVLDLGSSDLSGPIPAWLGELKRLQLLYLDNNRFEGELPAELGKLSRLQELTLFGNRGLVGALPETLTGIEDLWSFEFHDTGLCAPLDESFQAWLSSIHNHQGPNCQPEPPPVRRIE